MNSAPPAPSQTAVEPVAWLTEWERDGEEWVNAHANELTAIDEARAHGGTITPLVPLSALTAQAAALVAAERDRDEAQAFVERLQAALFFWMPGVRPETNTGLARSAGDDAYLLSGYSGPELGPCWGDDILATVATLKARVAELEAGLEPFAKAAADIDDHVPDRSEMWDHPASMQVTAGDFRRARRLTHQEKNNGR